MEWNGVEMSQSVHTYDVDEGVLLGVITEVLHIKARVKRGTGKLLGLAVPPLLLLIAQYATPFVGTFLFLFSFLYFVADSCVRRGF